MFISNLCTTAFWQFVIKRICYVMLRSTMFNCSHAATWIIHLSEKARCRPDHASPPPPSFLTCVAAEAGRFSVCRMPPSPWHEDRTGPPILCVVTLLSTVTSDNNTSLINNSCLWNVPFFCKMHQYTAQCFLGYSIVTNSPQDCFAVKAARYIIFQWHRLTFGRTPIITPWINSSWKIRRTPSEYPNALVRKRHWHYSIPTYVNNHGVFRPVSTCHKVTSGLTVAEPYAMNNIQRDNYLRQGGYVIIVVCLFVCLFVSNFAQKLPNGFTWNFQGRLAMGQWTND